MADTNAELTKFLANRIANTLQAEWDYWLSFIGIRRFRHMPTFLSIEPANFCQLRCPECPVGMAGKQENRRKMSIALFQQILEEAKPYVHTMQFYFQGEPLLNEHLGEMIRLAHEAGIYTVVSTNAQALTRALAEQLVNVGLSRIIVSIDGLSEESYGAYRQGGSLHKALLGLGYLKAAKQQTDANLTIELQCLRLKSNEHEWQTLTRSFRQMGADKLTLKTAQFYGYEQGNMLMPTQEKYSRYRREKDGLYHPKNRLKNKYSACRRLYMGAVIDAEGIMLPCCFDKGRKYSFGSVQELGIRGCWLGQQAERFRDVVLRNDRNLDICRNCTE